MATDAPTVHRLWWVQAGVCAVLGFRPGRNRPTVYTAVAAISVAVLVAEVFRRAGLAAVAPQGRVSNVAILLGLYQLLLLLGAKFGREGELFQDPRGPLLPYTAPMRVALWTGHVLALLAIGLAGAYAGVGVGMAHLPGALIVSAWAIDVVTLATLALGLELVRWTFRTYAPIELQRLWALLVIAVFNVVTVATGAVCIVVALQFGTRQVFISPSITEFLAVAASTVEESEAAGVAASFREARQNIVALEQATAMAALVTAAREPSGGEALQRTAGFAGVLLLMALLPGRRPEEREPVRRFAHVAREWATAATVRLWPMPVRVPWRLMLGPLYIAMRYTAFGAFMLLATSLFLAWATLSPTADDAGLERVLTVYAGLLVGVIVLVQVAVADGLGVQPSSYVRYAAFPVATDHLLTRMLWLGVLCGGALTGLLAFTWGVLVRGDASVALLFAVSVAVLVPATTCAFVALIATYWTAWVRLPSGVAHAWALVPAVILVWQFSLLRTSPDVLPLAAGGAAAAGAFAAAAARAAIRRMVATREPAVAD